MHAQADHPCPPSQPAHLGTGRASEQVGPTGTGQEFNPQQSYQHHAAMCMSDCEPRWEVLFEWSLCKEMTQAKNQQLKCTTVIDFYQQAFITAIGNEWPSIKQPGDVLGT